jgi:hypothetical protein
VFLSHPGWRRVSIDDAAPAGFPRGAASGRDSLVVMTNQGVRVPGIAQDMQVRFVPRLKSEPNSIWALLNIWCALHLQGKTRLCLFNPAAAAIPLHANSVKTGDGVDGCRVEFSNGCENSKRFWIFNVRGERGSVQMGKKLDASRRVSQ